MSSGHHHPVPVEMDSDLAHHAEVDQNPDQFSLIQLLNLDCSDPSSNAPFINNPHPFQFHLPSIASGALDYHHQHHQLEPSPTVADNLASIDNSLQYSLDLDLECPRSIPSATPSSSSPSWSPLDQILFPPHIQHPQSSPLFPLDLIPNWQDSSSDPNQQSDLNSTDFSASISLDSQLEDWKLIFDSLQSNQESNSYELAPFYHLSDNEPCQQPSLEPLQAPVVPTEIVTEFSRSYVEGESFESPLYSINSDAIDFPSPFSPNNYNPSSPVKRKRPANPPLVGSDPIAFDPLGIHMSSSSADQQEDAMKESTILDQIDHNKPKPKRAKTSASRAASNSKSQHACVECGKSFPRLTSLTQHKLIHNGERPFRCTFEGCAKSFTTSSNAKRHWRTHF